MDQFVYITCPSMDEARSLGRHLVDAKLAGCVNIIPNMESIYMWNGALCQESEVILIAKTTSEKMAGLTSGVMERHSYSTPCVASIQVIHQNKAYATWLRNCLSD